jgi:putative SOS response-associated peptidase YedK
MINARAETVATAPAFRTTFKSRRCLIPVSGFYEWKKLDAKSKQPMHVGRKDGAPFASAGRWTRWGPKDEDQLETCTIVTSEPNELCAPINNRMPVILAPSDYARWLDVERAGATDLLQPYPAGAMIAHPVSTRVNSSKNDDAESIELVAQRSSP